MGLGAAVIEARGVSRAYQTAAETVWAVRNVALTVHSGEFVCIYGASGSGKSTLLHLLAGLDLSDSGEIHASGLALSGASEGQRAQLRREVVGVVFQEHLLIEEFTALENVSLPLEARGQHPRSARAEAARALERMGLSGLGYRFPAQMSGGQRQRVGVARALVGGRSILLADEPTGALDSAATIGLFTLFQSLCREDGVAAVVCSHDLRCRSFADTVYEITDGTLASH